MPPRSPPAPHRLTSEQSATPPGTIASLVALYAVQCAKFNYQIAAETRRTQWAILQRFRDEHGEKRVAMLKRQHVEAMLADKAPYPRRNWIKRYAR